MTRKPQHDTLLALAVGLLLGASTSLAAVVILRTTLDATGCSEVSGVGEPLVTSVSTTSSDEDQDHR